MRIAIHLSKEEARSREARLASAPEEADAMTGDLAELIWDLAPDGAPLEGVDLHGPDGLLHTIVGDPPR